MRCSPAIVLFLAPFAAEAETLAEARADAVLSNPALAAARARLEAAHEALPEAWSQALPQIAVSGLAARSDQDSDTPSLDHEDESSWESGVSGSQLLYGGGRVLASTRAARALIQSEAASYDLALQTLLVEVTGAYADVLLARAVVSARQTGLSNLTALSGRTHAQFEAGLVTRTDVAQAQAREAQARLQLIEAQGALAGADLAYQVLVGHPPRELEAPAAAPDLPEDIQIALEIANRQSPLLRSADAELALANANLAGAAAQGRLRVTIEAGRTEGATFGDPASAFNADTVAVRVSAPLFQGGLNWSRTRRERALRAAAGFNLSATQRRVEEQVGNAWTNLTSARAAIVAARQRLEAATLAFEGVEAEQQEGLRSTIEVLDQEQDLLSAQIDRAQTQRDIVVAEAQLLLAIGQLAQ